jgi:hypothetical protein
VGTIFIVFLLGIFAVALIRLAHNEMDRRRIRGYVESHGDTFIEAKWAPFGPGWLGGIGDRIYVVRYLDRNGIEHAAYCKTSGWSGVYFTEDRNVTITSPLIDELEALEEENRQLRAELERLKRRQGGDQDAIKRL